MKIGSLDGLGSGLLKPQNINETPASGFGDLFMSFVKDVNSSQLESGKIVERFAGGEDIELHEVMIAGEKAKTSLELLVEIRNKAIDMYRELIRMQ